MTLDPTPNSGGTGNPTGDGLPNGDGGTPPGSAGGAGDGDASWLDSLPEDLRTNKSLLKFTDVANLAKGYVNAEQLLGRDKIPMPVTDDDWNSVYDRLGRPTSGDEYKLELGEFELPDFLKEPLESDTKWFREAAHRLGLNHKQASALYSEFATNMGSYISQRQQEIGVEVTKTEQALRGEYGEAYEHKISLANRALTHLGGQELVDAIATSGLGRHPGFIRMMVKVGERISEEMGVDRAGQPVYTPNDLQTQLSAIHAHPAYLDRRHPEHKAKVEEAMALMRRLYPE